jgi:predicted nuclease of predicted toxin-antitoxin system
MPRTIWFHMDENVSSAISRGLRQRGIDVTTSPEIGLLSVSDEGQLEFAFSQNRVLFTQDRDFLRLHNSGVEHAGIIYCIKSSRSISEIVRGLVLVWELLEPEDMHRHVEFTRDLLLYLLSIGAIATS